MRLLLNQIRTDGGTQARAFINQVTVVEYATAIKEGHRFPPVVVFYDGTFNWLADGFHRLFAHLMANLRDIEVELKLGSLRDAILYAVSANAEHGLRRTPADKHIAVSRLLADEEWSSWSDRMLAQHTHTSHPFVAKVRMSIATGNNSSRRTYVNQYGSLSTMETKNIGKSSQSSIEAEKFSKLLQPSLLSKLHFWKEKLGLDSLEATITRLLDTSISYPKTPTETVTDTTVKRWLGLDPGLATVRWALLYGEAQSHQLPKILDYGTIDTTKKRPTSERLWELEQDLVLLLRELQPTNIALEIPLIGQNPKTTRNVLEAAGVLQLVCYRERGITPVHLYPSMWKAHLGSGRADTDEITDTIQGLFELNNSKRTRLDALGIAYAAYCGVKVGAERLV